ncbi:MAG: PqqD family protein [Candidatus Aminicenantaceae bacterium]
MNHYSRYFHVPWREIEKKAVVVSVKENEVIVFNEVGTEIWKFLENEKRLDEIINHVLTLFESNRDTVEKDVRDFLTELQKKELLDVKEKPGG